MGKHYGNIGLSWIWHGKFLSNPSWLVLDLWKKMITESSHMGVDTMVCSFDKAPLKIQPSPCIEMLLWAWFCHQFAEALEDRKVHRKFPLFIIHAPLLHLLRDSTFHPFHKLINLLLESLRGIKFLIPKYVHKRQYQSFVLALIISLCYRGTRRRTWPLNHIFRGKIKG